MDCKDNWDGYRREPVSACHDCHMQHICHRYPEMRCDMQPVRCKTEKECVKTYTSCYKVYKFSTYRIYKVCQQCGCEHDSHHHYMCPKCGNY